MKSESHKNGVILLVDDEPVMRRLFGGRLKNLGYEIIYANDGNEGREMARRLQPNLVLMDLDMPVMDGMEAATRMKKEKETEHIPIIMLTNEDASIEAQKALNELGVDGYAHKSEDFSKLSNLINLVLMKNEK